MKPTILAALLALALVAPASANDFVSTHPTPRVEYWQNRQTQIEAFIADPAKLKQVRLLFVGDSITDFFQLGDNPWVPGQRFGRTIWDESFNHPGTANYAFNIGISGDRTEHVLYRLLPKAKGGLGELDSPALDPDVIVLMIGINNSWAAETPIADSIYEGARAVLTALHARKPRAKIVLQSLLPIVDVAKDRNVVRPVNVRLRALAQSPAFAGSTTFLDLYPSFVDRTGTQITRYFNDGIHPSEAGYRVWRDQLVPFLAEVRKKKR
jgi:lysophospholipase L1-like esterase